MNGQGEQHLPQGDQANDPALDRLADLLLEEKIGGQRPPDLKHRILQAMDAAQQSAATADKGHGRRLVIGRRWAVAASALVAVALALWWARSDTRYPSPAVSGGITQTSGAELGKGSELATMDSPGVLTLGGYCRIEVAPNSRLVLEGDRKDESVYLHDGEILCEVNHGVGEFAVKTDFGVVMVHGTKFKVAIVDGGEQVDLAKGGGQMTTHQMFVAVISGLVFVNSPWGIQTVSAGEDARVPAVVTQNANPGAPTNAGQAGGQPATGPDAKPATYWHENTVRVQVHTFLMQLANLNMTPDFSLDKAQKEKIAALKAEFDAAVTKFQADNNDEGVKLQDALQKALHAKDRDQAKIQEYIKQQQELMAKGPKSADTIAKVKELLTADQAKVLEDKLAAQKAGMGKLREGGRK